MPHVLRRTVALSFALGWPAAAEPADNNSEYKQADTSFYLKSDVVRADAGAVILPAESVTDIGSSYLSPSQRHPAKTMYLQQTRDWIEPITPPSMPASLNIPSDEMQVREPQGGVQVALPSAPADFHAVDEGMTIPNGSVLRTADNASVAVLFGGVDSVRLAPNSQAAVQMSVTPGLRDAEVDIQGGMVFSKVGQRIGEKESYAVKTPFGTATAHGTDFVTVVLPQRVDVFVAEGTVVLAPPAGERQSVTVAGRDTFKVMRFPVVHDAVAAEQESAESLTTILNFIPMANQKLKRLSDRARNGDQLSATEQAYVGRIRKVPALIKLALVESPGMVPLEPPGPARPLVRPIAALPFEPAPPRATPVKMEKSAPPVQAVVMDKPAPRAKPVALEIPVSKVKPVLAQTPSSNPKPATRERSEKNTALAPSSPSHSAKPAPTKAALPLAANPSTPLHVKSSLVQNGSAPKSTSNAKTSPPAAIASLSKQPKYPRAKAVSAAELAQMGETTPIVVVAKRHTTETGDPNSLGAPLNPTSQPIGAGMSAATGSTASSTGMSASSPSKQAGGAIAHGSNDTVP